MRRGTKSSPGAPTSLDYAPDLTLRVRFTSRRNPHQALRPFLHNLMRVQYPDDPRPVFVFTLTEVLAN